MRASELRRLFLDFFAQRGHRIIRSDSLIPPAEDKSLLFTGAGMNQFKNEFMGRGAPDLKRAATSQKCLRTADLDNVGRTAYHHTFFEMLGNFSFGDYFKREAILWAWEFMTRVLRVPPEKLQVSVYKDDDEAFTIWEKEVGLPARVIHRFGEHDNFWPADAPTKGPNGLCGPCSEIFYDWGPSVGCGRPDCNPSCDCDRFCEVWNLVFQQFYRKDGGILDPLPTRNIDTGMGLERLAAVMQGKLSNFDTDLFVPIIRAIERESEQDYGAVRSTPKGMAFRRIADHARAATFCICDGVLPSNAGRGYVLRKLIRRALLGGRRLGLHKPFLYRLVPVVTSLMQDQYPELVERRENIAQLIRIEEERFLQTLERGMDVLQEMISELRKSGQKALPGAEAFRLFDTYGLPFDVTESVLEDEGFTTSLEEFQREMERQRELSRKRTSLAADIFGSGPIKRLRETGVTSTTFTGYERDEERARVIGLVAGDDLVQELASGMDGIVVLDRTPFYGEAGGEVGDTGIIEGADSRFEVTDTKRGEGMTLHVGRLLHGRLRTGDAVTAKPDRARREAIRRNHTATHLLHMALREVLGPHAQQAGSYVGPDRLRFDFTHPRAMTQEEVQLVEDIVNRRILANDSVTWRYMKLEEARAEGATALFGEKYGDIVRLLEIGGYSKELCGGLHCRATGDIGLFKILSESSVAAGVRRIEAVTGTEALAYVRSTEEMIRTIAEELGVQQTQIVERVRQLQKQIKDLRREIQRTKESQILAPEEYLERARIVGDARIVTARLDDATPDEMRALADRLRQSGKPVGVVLGSARDGKVALVVAFSRDLVARGCNASDVARAAASLCGGGGGGRPDMAQAGGKDPGALDAAIQKAADLAADRLRQA